jgi:DNA-binding IclR family transcriptional regulator
VDKTVVKGLAMLEHLVELGRPAGVTELAIATGLHKSNVHRVLSSLRVMGYVRSNADSLYEPTLRLWEFGQRVLSRFDIAAAGRPFLRRLMQRTDETAHLSLLDGLEVVYVDVVETTNAVRAHTPLGGRVPAYCTASGKALLLGQPPGMLLEVARTITRLTPATLGSHAELLEALAQARVRGYATNIGEYRANVVGLAAPIVNRRGDVIAAVGVAGPLERMGPARLEGLAPGVIAAAKDIARVIGAG